MTHRIVLDGGDNRFWHVDDRYDNDVYLDDVLYLSPPAWVFFAKVEHDETGYHKDCLICQDKAEQKLSDEADARRELRFGCKL